MGIWAERTHSHKATTGGPSEVADCGMGQARLQLTDPTGVAGRPYGPTFAHR